MAPLLLVLDGVTDPRKPRRLPARGRRCRRARGDRAKDHACGGVNATVARSLPARPRPMPYFMVTNLART